MISGVQCSARHSDAEQRRWYNLNYPSWILCWDGWTLLPSLQVGGSSRDTCTLNFHPRRHPQRRLIKQSGNVVVATTPQQHLWAVTDCHWLLQLVHSVMTTKAHQHHCLDAILVRHRTWHYKVVLFFVPAKMYAIEMDFFANRNSFIFCCLVQ